jgi:NADH:ubiquinone oxidoreductase subunit 6 (subunit J)
MKKILKNLFKYINNVLHTKDNTKILIICFIGLAAIGLTGAKVGIDTKFYVYIGTIIIFFLFIFAIFSNKKKIKEYASKF